MDRDDLRKAVCNAIDRCRTYILGNRPDGIRNDDHIESPFITKGRDLVNIVPADVRMEAYVLHPAKI